VPAFRKIAFLLLVLFFIFRDDALAQLHYKFPVTNFTPRDYGKNQGVQNWALTQSAAGILYSASNNGVIEYDGFKWKFLPVVNGKWVYSLATDSSNVMYAGSEGNFGYFQKDEKGRLSYVSLSDSLLKEEDKFFTRIWRIFAGTDRIYFQSNEAIFVYDHKTLKTLYPLNGTSFHLASFANNTLYVRERQKGLMKCVNDQLVLIPNSQLFAEYGVFAMLPFQSDKSKILVVTKEKGLYTYNSKTDEFSEFITPENSVWYNANLIGGIRLRNGWFALNSESFGTIVLNESGTILHYINNAIGLQDDNVVAQLEDRSGNLWLALNKGLSKADITSPLQSYTNLQGSIYNAVRYKNTVYLATSNGLFLKQDTNADFSPDPDFPYSFIIWHLFVDGKRMLMATNSGLYLYDGPKSRSVAKGNFRKVIVARNGKIIAGGPDGLEILKSDYRPEHNFEEEISGEILGIEEDPASTSEHSIYWISTNAALYKIMDEAAVYKVKPYDVSYGLTEDWKYPFIFNNKLAVGNNFGLYELDAKKGDSSIFEPIPFYGNESAGKSFSFLKDYSDKTVAIIENKPHLVFKNNKKEVYRPFLPIDLGKENALYSDRDQLFICLDEGVVIYNEKDTKNYDLSYETVIRRIGTKQDSLLFDGAATGIYTISQPLGFAWNELNIEFASNYYCYEDRMLFRYRLEDMDTSWSAWQSDHKVRFNNLHEGNYRLIVQSKNIYDTIGKDAEIAFSIQPPWYRTTLAWILYVIGFALFVYLAVRIASYRLKQQNKQLDELVKKRTKEIEHKNEELKEQNIQILHQKQEITDSINYAKRIQNAILPPFTEIKNAWPDTFVFFQPKDIVSGDFYWFHKISEQEFLIASADCTGHGVPGGFMSMVCSDKLNEAVTMSYEPDVILNRVNVRIKQSLRQDNREGSTKDGMEIALLKVNKETGKLKYAGANRFLWIIRHGSEEVIEIKPTKAGIGGYTEDSQEFTAHEIAFHPGDRFYMSTDGYGDQFGGAEGKKLMTKNFKQFLLSIKDLNIEEQGKKLEQHINDWKAHYEQVDDILVIGLRM
jgi:serine phosphatase RsbU (regulator of sigma subunit)